MMCPMQGSLKKRLLDSWPNDRDHHRVYWQDAQKEGTCDMVKSMKYMLGSVGERCCLGQRSQQAARVPASIDQGPQAEQFPTCHPVRLAFLCAWADKVIPTKHQLPVLHLASPASQLGRWNPESSKSIYFTTLQPLSMCYLSVVWLTTWPLYLAGLAGSHLHTSFP